MFNTRVNKFREELKGKEGLIVVTGKSGVVDSLKVYYSIISDYELKKSLGFRILKLFQGNSVFFYDSDLDPLDLKNSKEVVDLLAEVGIYFNSIVANIGYYFGYNEHDESLLGFWKSPWGSFEGVV